MLNLGKVSRETRYCPIEGGVDANALLRVFKKNIGGQFCYTTATQAVPPGSTGWSEVTVQANCPSSKPARCTF